MEQFSKRVRKLFRDAARVAYERELGIELEKLHLQFLRWKDGAISAFELADEIHHFHQGPQRELYNRYQLRYADFSVARAVLENLMRLDELHPDLHPFVKNMMSLSAEGESAAEKTPTEDTAPGAIED